MVTLLHGAATGSGEKKYNLTFSTVPDDSRTFNIPTEQYSTSCSSKLPPIAMWRKTRSTAALVFLTSFHFLFATKAGIVAVPPVDLEVRVISDKVQMLGHVLKVVNHADSAFSGVIGVDAPAGIGRSHRENGRYALPRATAGLSLSSCC